MNLLPSNSVSMTELMTRLDQVKLDPASLTRLSFDYLDEVLAGQVNIVDPTNPFVYLLEMSAVNTAVACNQHPVTHRKVYPSLTVNQEELYHHMADVDYLDRFATPAETTFTIVVQRDDLFSNMVYDDLEKCHKAIVPRETEFYVDNVVYSLQYPVVIRKYLTGQVDISYDTDITSPLMTLSTNQIVYTQRRSSDGVNWIFFDVNVKQLTVNSELTVIQETELFEHSVAYNDQFHYCRIYFKNALNPTWTEINTTHSDLVYDANKPTAVLQVLEDSKVLNVFIPIVYILTGKISGELRIDVYVTKGAVSYNYDGYKPDAFQMKLRALDPERDMSVYTTAFGNSSFYGFTKNTVNDGSNGRALTEMRELVIFNSVGDKQKPITNIELKNDLDKSGFTLVPNVDVLTNRIFLAIRKLPYPTNTKLLTAANVGINTYFLNPRTIGYPEAIRTNGLRTTLLSNNIFVNKNGVIEVVDPDYFLQFDRQALVYENAANQYLYNPFYYVIDNSGKELEVRAYHLDQPKLENLNFVAQNETLLAPVNTASFNITKVTGGYRILITTLSGNNYKSINDGAVGLHVAFKPAGESKFAYVVADYVGKTNAGERVYQVILNTSYDVNSSDQLEITNTKIFDTNIIETRAELSTTLHLFYTTTSITNEYRPITEDSMIASQLLPTGSACLTHETFKLTFGTSLKNLWTRSRNLPSSAIYKKYPTDIPLLYSETIYDRDPVTGAIFSVVNGEVVYNVAHPKGDPVLDANGDPLMLHHAGDIIVIDGSPVVDSTQGTTQELDLLLIDGKYIFATDSMVADYRQIVNSTLESWVTETLAEKQKIVLEKTKIYFYPTTTLGKIKVSGDGGALEYIDAEQSPKVEFVVTKAVFDDDTQRSRIERLTTSVIDAYLNRDIVNINEIEASLKEAYQNSVISFKVSGLGGAANFKYIDIEDGSKRMCLKKKLELLPDNSIVVTEDITFEYKKIG